MRCECGAPVRGQVCQRGHRVLREDWKSFDAERHGQLSFVGRENWMAHGPHEPPTAEEKRGRLRNQAAITGALTSQKPSGLPDARIEAYLRSMSDEDLAKTPTLPHGYGAEQFQVALKWEQQRRAKAKAMKASYAKDIDPTTPAERAAQTIASMRKSGGREHALRVLEGVRQGNVDPGGLPHSEVERLRSSGASWLIDAESRGDEPEKMERVRAGLASLPRNVMAEGIFDELKHPRGRGGKFRSKGGIIEPKGRGGKRLKVPQTPGTTEPTGVGQKLDPDVDPRQREWDTLDREAQEYTGRPRAPRSRAITARQIELTAEMHTPQSPGAPDSEAHDLVVVGTGPGGLTAATYGGSEGLDTLVLDAGHEGGGQARFSSRIENLIPFPAGIKGRELMKRSLETTQRFAKLKLDSKVMGMDYNPESGIKTLHMADGPDIKTRAVIVGTGVKLHKMDFPGSDSKDVVYADAQQIRRRARGGNVVIVGGGNSAAQAALDLARTCPHVTILLRHGELGHNTSAYLVGQIGSDPNITVENGEVASATLGKGKRVAGVKLKDGRTLPARAIGMFIGAKPQVDWTGDEVEKDARGFVNVGEGDRQTLETSMPGVYAIGDARSGSGRKVATAIGDGGMAVTQMHRYIEDLKAQPMQEAKQPSGKKPKGATEAWLALARLAQEVDDEESPSTELDTSDDEQPETVSECACGAPFRASGVCQRGHRAEMRTADDGLAALARALRESWEEWDAARKAGKFSKSVKSGPMPGGIKDSPGRGPTGKIRNFEAMGADKLSETLEALQMHGEDPEAHKAAMTAAGHKLGVKFKPGTIKVPAKVAGVPAGQHIFVG